MLWLLFKLEKIAVFKFGVGKFEEAETSLAKK